MKKCIFIKSSLFLKVSAKTGITMFFSVLFTYIASDEINFGEILEHLKQIQVFVNKTFKRHRFRAPGGLGSV